jgi:hypothetical protein
MSDFLFADEFLPVYDVSDAVATVADADREAAWRTLLDVDLLKLGLPHGHVAASRGVLRELDLERLIGRERCRERDLAVAMVCQRLLAPCSKLSTTRLVHQTTLAEELSLGEVKEAELLQAMDWLRERQERIEGALARRHLRGEGFVLYDLSSSYLEGRRCELAAVGYSRDGKPSKPHITYGLCCAPSGQPISIQVHPGGPAHRPRRALPQHDPDRQQPLHLHPPDHPHRAADRRLPTHRRQAFSSSRGPISGSQHPCASNRDVTVVIADR